MNPLGRIKHIDKGILIIFILYILFSVWFKYNRWLSMTPSMDYHSYLQMMWNTQQGNLLEYNGLKHDIRMMFQYHFAVILIPLSLFYILIPHQLTLYIVSSIIIATSVFPLYYLSKNFLKSRYVPYIIVLIFLFYPPFLNVDLEGYAEELFSVPFVLFALYYLVNNKNKLFTFFSLLTLTLRINMTAVVFSLGFLSLFYKKYKTGISIMISSVLWLLFIILFINKIFPTPIAKNQTAEQYVWGFYALYGDSPQEIITTIVTKPKYVIEQILVKEKGIYFLDLFKPLFFLPLLSPYTYFAFPIFMQNILTDDGRLFAVYNYYQASMLPFMFLGLIHAISWISANIIKFKQNKHIKAHHIELLAASVILVFLVFFYDTKELPARRLPFNSYYNTTFMSISFKDIEYRKVAHMIPSNFSMGVEEKFMEHIAERKYYFNSENYKTIPMDLILTDSFDKPVMAKELILQNQFRKIFSHHYLNLYANTKVIEEKNLNDDLNLESKKQYIIALPTTPNIYKTNPDQSLQNESTSLYYKRNIAQPFKALNTNLEKITFVGQRINTPKGNLVIEIVTDKNNTPNEDENLFSTAINLSTFSLESDVIEIPININDLETDKIYWLVLKMDTENNDHHRFDVMKAKSLDLPLDFTMTKYSQEDKSWELNWSDNLYRLESTFYFKNEPRDINNYEDLGFTKLSDETLMISGTSRQIETKLENLKKLNQTQYSKLIIVSK